MIITIGEIVWDSFARRRILGGAPLNAAYHLTLAGLETRCISRIGDDAPGEATLEWLHRNGLSPAGIQRDPELPTGEVRITIGADHEPSFEIVAPAAWDAIEPQAALRAAGPDFILVHGTLGQRDARSRAAIRALRERSRLVCYDVNLRPPFTPPELVFESLPAADIVKVNDTELRQIAGWLDMPVADQQKAARQVRKRYDLLALAVSHGARGASLATRNAFLEHSGFPVTVADTVGAGDAFFAALLAGYLVGSPWPETLAAANRQGAYVASQPGATPPQSEDFS